MAPASDDAQYFRVDHSIAARLLRPPWPESEGRDDEPDAANPLAFSIQGQAARPDVWSRDAKAAMARNSCSISAWCWDKNRSISRLAMSPRSGNCFCPSSSYPARCHFLRAQRAEQICKRRGRNDLARVGDRQFEVSALHDAPQHDGSARRSVRRRVPPREWKEAATSARSRNQSAQAKHN